MITTVTCEQCGKQFTAWFTRRFCDECRRLRNIAVVKRSQAAHRGDEAWRERRRASARRYAAARREEMAERCRQWRARKKKEAQSC